MKIKIKTSTAMMVNGQIMTPDSQGFIEIPRSLAESMGLVATEAPEDVTSETEETEETDEVEEPEPKPTTAKTAKQNATK